MWELPDYIVKKAEEIEREYVKRTGRAQSQDAKIASMYIAARIHGYPVSLGILEGGIRRSVMKKVREIVETLSIKLPPPNVKNYIDYIADALELDTTTRRNAHELADMLQMTGKEPWSFAAALIYVASVMASKPLSIKEICSVASTTPDTLRKRIREILYRLPFPVPYVSR